MNQATHQQINVIEGLKKKKISDGYEIRSEGVDFIGLKSQHVMKYLTYGRPGQTCAYHDWWIIGPRGAISKKHSAFY